MNKKQFEHIENRIKEAAENSEPAFDEHAWTLMEARLDKEDNKKPRFLLWWFVLPFLFIAAGILYFYFNNKPADKITANEKGQIITKDKSALPQNIPAATSSAVSNRNNGNKKINFNKNKTSGKDQAAKQLLNSINVVATDFSNRIPEKIQDIKKGKLSSIISAGIATETDSTSGSLDFANSISEETVVNKVPGNNDRVILNDTLIKTDSSKINIVKNLPDKKRTTEIKGLKPSRFYFLASLGADAANVKLLSFKNSQVTAKYGVGIGYQLNKKLSVQTGFYAVRKKYVAGPGDYNAKSGSYWSTVQILKVDASCLVYEIPLTLRYNVFQKPTTLYYATAGLSSYIMKNEAYKYNYIRYNMPYESSKVYTGNKNFFSVSTLSVGIEKKISPYISIQAEPSVSLPISGVGDGRVKLYSTALQVAIKYQPGKKRK